MTNPFTIALRPSRHLRTVAALSVLLSLAACGAGGDAVLAGAPGALTLTIDGLIDGVSPSIELVGPNGYQKTIRHSETIEDLDLGTYQIQASPTTAQSTTWSPTSATQSVTLSSGAPAASAVVRYQLATGALDLRIEGLPASTGSAVHLSGPAGFTLDLASTAVLRGLAPGSYTLSAASRTIGTSVYFPADSVRTVNVAASLVPATATFTYSRAMAALEVVVTGLPAGALGQYSLTGPGAYSSAVSTASQFENLDPGNYVALPVPIVWQGHTWSPIAEAYPVAINPGTNQVEIPYTISTGALDIEVDGLPAGAQAQYTVTGPGGFTRSGDADQSLVGLWPGTYTVTATAVIRGGTTYSPRKDRQNTTITPGQTPKRNKVEYSASDGAIAMTVVGLPSQVEGRVIVRGTTTGSVDTLSGTGTLAGLAPDTYAITAQAVSSGGVGYDPTPATQSAVLAAGDTAYGSVVYASQAPTTGALSLTISGLPSGAAALLSVTGPGGYAATVTAGNTLGNLVAGTYTITAQAVTVAGTSYAPTPATQTATVTGGTTASRAVTYAAAATSASLQVVINGLPTGQAGDVDVQWIAGGFSRHLTATTTLSDLGTPGTYVVTAHDVTAGGQTYTPTTPSQSAYLTSGAAASKTVDYQVSGTAPATGGLTVTVTGLPSGANASVTVTGPGGYSQALSATGTLNNLVAGTYTVAAQAVTSGGTTYNPAATSQTVSVTAGATATKAVSYSAAAPTTGGLTLTVSGLPSGSSASIVVTGPSSYSQAVGATTTLTAMAPGTYTITAQSVSASGASYAPTPASQTVAVTAGATAAKSVAYAVPAPTTGTLAVSVSGLPGGTSAAVAVTGPGGFSQALTGSATLPSLAVGTYTITAQSVSAGGTGYAPTPASQTASVTAGGSVSRSVAYTATPGSGGPADIVVDTTTQYQVMTGWEATSQAGQDAAGYSGWSNTLFTQAASDLGITRMRVEIKENAESTNDNGDPNVINMSGFNWTDIDNKMTRVVMPFRQKVLAQGQPFYMNLNYVAFRTTTGHLHSNPAEYAELILATFLHLQSAYGVVPDAVEVILEPDNGTFFGQGSGTLVGQAIVAAGARLAAAGFHPDFIAPSVMAMSRLPGWFDNMIAVPGVTNYLTDISYHRYSGVSDANLQAIAQRAAAYGLRTSMLEHIASGVEDLYKDLTIAGNSAWQQYTLAYPTTDNGAQYYTITSGAPVMGSRTKLLWQYFHYVRPGARRVAVSSSASGVRPVAFKNPAGGMAVVLHVDAAGSYTLGGLRTGTYEVTFTNNSGSRTTLPSVTATSGGTVTVSPSAIGVLTLSRVP